MSKTASKKAINIIKKFEGCSLKAYRDSVGVWTIGYGTTNSDKSITGITIKAGVKITQAQAENFLLKSVNKKYAPVVNKYYSTYKFNQNQFDALVSFAYNIGSIDSLTASGTRSISVISQKILAYDKAGGQTLRGLTRRRKMEKKLFDTSVYKKPTLKVTANSKPCYIKWVQDKLGLNPSGNWNNALTKKVVAYKKNHNIKNTDGSVVGMTMIKKLNS